MAKGLTAAKAKKILQDGYVKGKPLTAKQKKYFGAIASGATPLKAIDGGWLAKYESGGEVPKAQLGLANKLYKFFKGADNVADVANTVRKTSNAVEVPKNINFYHAGLNPTATIDDIDITRLASRQQKKGRDYAGFYMSPNLNEGSQALNYARQNPEKALHQIQLPKNSKVFKKEGSMERISQKEIKDLQRLGYDYIEGKNLFGQPEYVLINKNKATLNKIEVPKSNFKSETKQFQNGGSLPGASGMMYSRNSDSSAMSPPNLTKAQDGFYKDIPEELLKKESNFHKGFYKDTGSQGEGTPVAGSPGLVNYGTPEYKKAYEEGTFADVPNQLDEVVMYSGVDYEKYPYYNDLSAEQRKYFDDDGPIGRGVRRAAYTKRGLAEDTYDVVNPLMYGMLGLAGGLAAAPSIATLGRAAAGPIGRALSYKPLGGPVSIGNVIDGGSAAYAAYATPEAYDKFKENPSFDTGLDLGLTAIDMVPFSEIFTGGKNIKNLYNKGKNLFTKTPTPAVSNTIDASVDPGIRKGLANLNDELGIVNTTSSQIRASEKFNKNWFNHPDIIKRTEQMINQPSKVRANMSEVEILQDINMYNTMLDKTPNLPGTLWIRIRENLKDLNAGLAKRNLEKVQQEGRFTEVFDENNLKHQEMGLHYDENPETLGLYKGRTNQASINVERIKEKARDVGSVITHEDLHAITVGKSGYTDEAKDILNSAVGKDQDWWLNKINTTKDQKKRAELIDRLEYLARPQEIHARVHELRKAFNLKPGQEVSPSKIEAMMTKGLKGETPVDEGFFRLLGDKENFRKIFNKLPAYIPAAVGLGAASQNKNGGNTPKAQVGFLSPGLWSEYSKMQKGKQKIKEDPASFIRLLAGDPTAATMFMKHGGKTPKAQVGEKVAAIASQMEANEEDGGRPPLGVVDHIRALFDEEGLCRDNTCVQTVKDFYTKAGIDTIPKDIYNNREFLKNFKEYGFEEVLDQKNLQPGDVLQYYYGPDSEDVKEDPSYLNFPYHMGVYVNPGEYIGDGDSEAPIQRKNMYTGIKDGKEYKKDPFRAFRYIKQNKNGSDVEKAQWGKLLKLAKKYGNKLFNFSKPAAKVDNTPALKYTDDIDMDMDVFNAKATVANDARKEYKKVKKNIKDGEGWKYEPGELEKLEAKSKFLDETIHFPFSNNSDVYTNLTRYNLSDYLKKGLDKRFGTIGNSYRTGYGHIGLDYKTNYLNDYFKNYRVGLPDGSTVPYGKLDGSVEIDPSSFNSSDEVMEELMRLAQTRMGDQFNNAFEKTSKIDFGDLLKNKNRNGGWLSKYENGGVIEDDRGQWAHPGEVTKINSNNITMKGVNYPVLGVSDTGDKKMMQPGKDYKFDGNSVTEYPMAQDGINAVPDPTPQINFLKDWANSTMHNKMLDASSTSDKFKDKVKRARTNFDDVTIGMFDDPGYLGQYLNSNIRMNPSLLEEAAIGNGYNSVLTHELSHYTDDVNPSGGYFKGYNIPLSDQKLIKDYSKKGIKRAKSEEKELNELLKSENMNPNSKDVIKDRVKRLKYLASPTETRSRINATRYFYENDKNFGRSSERNIDKNLPSIFDSEVTPDMIKVMQESGQYKQLQEIYTDDQILEMFNTISDNSKSSDPSNMAYAKEGESLVALDQLTNFTNYNTPQPGGWLDKY